MIKTIIGFLRLWLVWICLTGVVPQSALAGAWPVPVGEGLLISKYETASAESEYDAKGTLNTLSHWAARDFSVYGERGFSKGITVFAKANYQSLKTPFERYEGFGTLEIGGRVKLWNSDWSTLALGGSVEGLGHGRRNDFDQQRSKTTDKEVRLYGGHSFRIKGMDSFIDLQVARRFRSSEADQWRTDLTLGLKPNANWLVMAQVWAGKTDRASWGRAVWVNQEISVARHFGPKQSLTLQLGIRQTTYGENVPRVRAASLSIWKRF
jgi:protein XagA